MVDSIRKYSVTANDIAETHQGSVFHWMLNGSLDGGRGTLPTWWSPARDFSLRQSLYMPFHDFWAASIGIAVTKMSSQSWELEGDAPRLRNQFQQLLLSADGNQSWVSFLARHLQDYLCTDNGAFIEIVRASNAAGSRILGLMHLDSLRCTRTGNPDIPVIYRDTKGIEHEVKDYQVLMLSDMPSSAESWFGVGFCAASRAWGAIQKMSTIERYIYEKVSGERPLAVHLVNGVNYDQMKTAMQSASEDKEAKGNVVYMGAVVIPTLSDVEPSLTTIPFAELPDGFDRQQEFNISVLQFANAIGLDPQDLQPLTGQPLGTATQSQVLHDKSQGKGLSAWRQQFTHLTNQFILPDAVTFAFAENDLRDKQQRADVNKVITDTVAEMVEKVGLSTGQGQQLLADEKIIPDEFVPLDQTPAETITDADQPESEAEQEAARAEQTSTGGAPPEPDITAATKEEPGATPEPFLDWLEGYRQRYAALSR